MKVLIVSDVHLNHERAEDIIKSEKPDEIIFLGDFWDDFDDDATMVRETSKWFQWSANQPNRTHLTGNHDIHYWFKDNTLVRCGGYDPYKSKIINEIVQEKDWEKLKFFHVLDGKWLISHGGIHPYWINPLSFNKQEPITISLNEIVQKLQHDSKDCIRQLSKGKSHWFQIAGFSRSLRDLPPYYGGLLWCDFNQEFSPIRGINQIIGHTPSREHVRWKYVLENDKLVHSSTGEVKPQLSEKASYNVCFDSYPALRWYATYENGELKICEFVVK